MDSRMSHMPDELFKVVGRKDDEIDKIARPSLTFLKDSWIRLKKNKAAIFSLIVLALIILFALIGPFMSSYNYYQTDYTKTYQPPGGEHWLGTDKFGRDQWTRIWDGTRISLYIAFLAAILDIAIGVTFGATAALVGGKLDSLMQRVIEILIGIPHLIIVILLIMMVEPGILSITVAMVITGWVNMARLVRAQIFKFKNQEFILASRSLGATNRRIMFHHMIPNTIGLIIINMMFTIPSAIFTEAFLSFIGLGLQAPQASLGVLINDGFQAMRTSFYLLIYPAIIITALMICFNLLADGLRDAFDPKMRK
ncbi:ABC transporter permease [Sporolactobacillus sp. Y61]|uniref:ABC transporter permease n=1 Tax=Sporolactobacillus sp. Y61 TaxID=3160863 RepID=A0AAU8IJ64_9BACL